MPTYAFHPLKFLPCSFFYHYLLKKIFTVVTGAIGCLSFISLCLQPKAIIICALSSGNNSGHVWVCAMCVWVCVRGWGPDFLRTASFIGSTFACERQHQMDRYHSDISPSSIPWKLNCSDIIEIRWLKEVQYGIQDNKYMVICIAFMITGPLVCDYTSYILDISSNESQHVKCLLVRLIIKTGHNCLNA